MKEVILKITLRKELSEDILWDLIRNSDGAIASIDVQNSQSTSNKTK